MSSTTIQTPLPIPVCDLPPPQSLSEKGQTVYDRVLAHFSNPDYVLPGIDAGKGSLMEEERMWLSYECIKRLEGTLKWRREFGLYSLAVTPGPMLEAEAASGYLFPYGYDPKGRPVVYYLPSNNTGKDDLQYVHFFFWNIERGIELMGPGIESATFLTDFANKGIHPSFYVTRQVTYNLQVHYPELINVSTCIHSPWLLNAFWDFVMPLMDSWTRSHITFDAISDEAGIWRSAKARDKGEPDALLVASDQLISDGFSGSVPFKYDHAVYWPALLAMCENRRKELTRVWRQLGGVVGTKEWDVNGLST